VQIELTHRNKTRLLGMPRASRTHVLPDAQMAADFKTSSSTMGTTGLGAAGVVGTGAAAPALRGAKRGPQSYEMQSPNLDLKGGSLDVETPELDNPTIQTPSTRMTEGHAGAIPTPSNYPEGGDRDMPGIFGMHAGAGAGADAPHFTGKVQEFGLSGSGVDSSTGGMRAGADVPHFTGKVQEFGLSSSGVEAPSAGGGFKGPSLEPPRGSFKPGDVSMTSADTSLSSVAVGAPTAGAAVPPLLGKGLSEADADAPSLKETDVDTTADKPSGGMLSGIGTGLGRMTGALGLQGKKPRDPHGDAAMDVNAPTVDAKDPHHHRLPGQVNPSAKAGVVRYDEDSSATKGEVDASLPHGSVNTKAASKGHSTGLFGRFMGGGRHDKEGVDVNGPHADVSAPTAVTGGPVVDLKSPAIDTQMPSATINAPTVGAALPTAGAPKLSGNKGPGLNANLPGAAGSDFEATINAPTVGAAMPTAGAPKLSGNKGPGLNANLPGAAGSDFETTINAPTVDAAVPSAGAPKLPSGKGPDFAATIDAPTADTSLPTAGVQAPTLDTDAPSATLDAGKGKKPGFFGRIFGGKAPEGDGMAPDVSADKPSLAAGAAGLGAGVAAGAAAAGAVVGLGKKHGTQINGPSVDDKGDAALPTGPKVVDDFPAEDTRDIDLGNPSDIDGPDAGLAGSLPHVEGGLPSAGAGISVPTIGSDMPSATINPPHANVTHPDMGDVAFQGSQVGGAPPGGVFDPSGAASLPSFKGSGPMQTGTINAPSGPSAGSSAQGPALGSSFKSPDIGGVDSSLTGPEVGAPVVGLTSPDVGALSANVQEPGVGAIPDASGFKGPNVGVPSADLKGPGLGGEFPDASASFKGPQADISGPSADFKGPTADKPSGGALAGVGVGAGIAGAAAGTAAAMGWKGDKKTPEVDVPSADKSLTADTSLEGASGDMNAPKKKAGLFGGLFGRKKADADVPSAGVQLYHVAIKAFNFGNALSLLDFRR
jgi:hypothetical protein